MSSKVKIALWISSLIVVLGLALGSFYWFGWRPSKITKDCTTETLDKMSKYSEFLDTIKSNPSQSERDKIKQDYFNFCLNSKGIK